LLHVALLVAIAGLLYCLSLTKMALEHPPVFQPRAPIDFDLVKHRFSRVQKSATWQEVEELLGPPSTPNELPPILGSLERDAKLFNRRMPLPGARVWQIWIDPNDEGKWVAVLMAGEKVYYKTVSISPTDALPEDAESPAAGPSER
jgi:hypothetical protein